MIPGDVYSVLVSAAELALHFSQYDRAIYGVRGYSRGINSCIEVCG